MLKTGLTIALLRPLLKQFTNSVSQTGRHCLKKKKKRNKILVFNYFRPISNCQLASILRTILLFTPPSRRKLTYLIIFIPHNPYIDTGFNFWKQA